MQSKTNKIQEIREIKVTYLEMKLLLWNETVRRKLKQTTEENTPFSQIFPKICRLLSTILWGWC